MDNPVRASCIGVIMDGNRRWAKGQGLSTVEGHTEGYKKLQEVVRWTRDAGIPHLIAYAFSIENWQRSKEEVGYLMKLFRSILEDEVQKMSAERIRVCFAGDRSMFDAHMQDLMKRAEEDTAKTAYDITLCFALSYGGRAEIVAAANTLLKEGVPRITEESFAQKLWTYPLPDPDIIIRTGGEKRLSGFLTWQSIYSELFFVDSFWPAFTKEEFNAVLAEFSERERRRGK